MQHIVWLPSVYRTLPYAQNLLTANRCCGCLTLFPVLNFHKSHIHLCLSLRYCRGAVLWHEPGEVHSSQFILRGQDQDQAGRIMKHDWGWGPPPINPPTPSTHFIHVVFWCQCLCLACMHKQSLIAISAHVVQWVSVWEASLQLSA